MTKKRQRLSKIFVMMLGLSISMPSISYASVFDPEMYILALKQLEELRAQYKMLSDTYKNAQNQLNTLNQLNSMHSGHYGFGDLNNNLDTLQNWQSPTSTWQDALQNLSGGNPERYRALMDAYEKNHPSLNESSYAQYTTPTNVTRFKEDKAVNRAVQVQTTESYNAINQHVEALYKLAEQIEKTPNTKGAIDLNSRLITELGFIQLMSVRLQTLMNQQAVQENLSELEDKAEMAKFNHLSIQ